jgi:hypothetical protein
MKCLRCGKLLKHGDLVIKVQQLLRGTDGLAAWDLSKDKYAHLDCPKK